MFALLRKKLRKLNSEQGRGMGLLILFFLSRLPFINAKNVLFDSKEYLLLFNDASFIRALGGGHFPHHEGYIIFGWPIYQLAKLLHLDPGYAVVVGQVALATITIYCFYKFIEFISNKTVALYSAIIFSLTPLFWITTVTITLETSYLSCFFGSLYLLTLYIKKNNRKFLYFSLLLLSLAIITYSAVVLWFPLYLFLIFSKVKRGKIKLLVIVAVFLGIMLSLRVVLLANYLHVHPFTVFFNLYLTNIPDAGHIQGGVEGLLIRIRNFIPVLRSYTSLVVILGFISLLVCFKKNKKYFLLGFMWLVPLLYSNQWWDSLFMGRYSIVAGFGFAFLVAFLIYKHRIARYALIVYLLIVSLPPLFLLRHETPYMQIEAFAKTLPKNSLFIVDHFALPVLEHCCTAKIIAVNDPSLGNVGIKPILDTYLAEKKPVYVSSTGLSDPYGLYTGPYLHPLSLSYTHNPELNPFLTNYMWEQHKIINGKDNLVIYKIVSPGKSSYPPMITMRDHYRRLDYYDPLRVLVNELTKKLNIRF
jgi:hypothetical protein